MSSVAMPPPIRRHHDGMPAHQLLPGDNNTARELFTSPWPANGGYWEEDGILYKPCYRCGDQMKVQLIKKSGGNMTFEKQGYREFCKDCNHPDLIGVFKPLDYGWIFERN